MTVRKSRQRVCVAAALCALSVLSGCARLGLGPPAGPPSPAVTSFDDVVPRAIQSLVHVPDLARSSRRFAQTDLARRLAEQRARGRWRRVDFFRPWVVAAYEQITDQVDELAWGTYGTGAESGWFLIARVNQPGRHVLNRLHKRVLPRVADEVPGIQLDHERFRGRRLYRWTQGEAAARHVLSYALVGKLLVMGSEAPYVRRAIERRPRRWLFGLCRRPGEPLSDTAELQTVFAGFEDGDDVHAWLRMARQDSSPESEPGSRLGRLAARIREIVASRIEIAAVDLRITPPAITGRWRLDLARAAEVGSTEGRRTDFAAVAPASAHTFLAIYHLPLEQALVGELRDLLAEAISAEVLDQLHGALAVVRLLPGIGDLPEMIRSLDRQVAYCSFAGEGDGKDRCVMIALENPAVVASGMRAVPGFLRRLVEKRDYRNRPLLQIPLAGGDSFGGPALAVVGGQLILAARIEGAHALIDGVETGETLARLPMVAQTRTLAGGRTLAEFFTAGRTSGLVPDDGPDDRPGLPGRLLRSLWHDPRVVELAAGRSYSICLERPRGVEIVTCSATGFHWSFATLGLAAVLLQAPPIAPLIESNETPARLESGGP